MVKITDTTLRDAHQSLIATRLRIEDMLPIAEKLDGVGFHSLEMWGGATFDTAMRFLKEDPWERIRILKRKMRKTPFQMLLRGQNLVGYKHYPDDVVEAFIHQAACNGIDIFRVFDALNDLRNIEKSAECIKKEGKHFQGAICFTLSPVHTEKKFVELARGLVDMGADSLCIKDMAGMISPVQASRLVGRLKKKVDIPIQLHTHETSGMGTTALMKAVEAGVDVIDTAISTIAGGTAQPPCESIVAMLKETPHDTGLDLDFLSEIASLLREIRKKYAAFESPYTSIDVNVLKFQIPGGMMSNLAQQLKEQNAEERMHDVLAEVPRVREEMGYPPLVTPSSQFVGTQAALNVITGERYKVVPKEIKAYVKGLYGKPPVPIKKEIAEKILGNEKKIECRPADLIPPMLEEAKRKFPEKNMEDVLSWCLFPDVAEEFLAKRGRGTSKEILAAIAAALFSRSSSGKAEVVRAPDSKWRISSRLEGASL